MTYKVTEEGNIATVFLDGEIDMDVTEKAKEVILPLVNSPDDLPCPKYSNAKNPNLFLTLKFKNFFGFSPSISEAKPGKNTMYRFFL